MFGGLNGRSAVEGHQGGPAPRYSGNLCPPPVPPDRRHLNQDGPAVDGVFKTHEGGGGGYWCHSRTTIVVVLRTPRKRSRVRSCTRKWQVDRSSSVTPIDFNHMHSASTANAHVIHRFCTCTTRMGRWAGGCMGGWVRWVGGQMGGWADRVTGDDRHCGGGTRVDRDAGRQPPTRPSVHPLILAVAHQPIGSVSRVPVG